ncbi:nitrogen fixation protein NifZ [Novosphingobium nitrogenifigens]|nr:nitrogen fixation protein NifZ [Novosphingobium nitrogenifigens]
MREPRFQWGQKVRACVDLVNDGSHPGHDDDALLVAAGTAGEVVNSGVHTDSNTPVYLVEFGPLLLVGCVEDELEAV